MGNDQSSDSKNIKIEEQKLKADLLKIQSTLELKRDHRVN
jgi:hypothetical protein